ncbi:MAG: hypothetical protein QOF61_1333 [Acidobacteriota bacterium]|jgi:hypothetical protein|nr:hypothetical protein [Acidobacteriota bacterium]
MKRRNLFGAGGAILLLLMTALAPPHTIRALAPGGRDAKPVAKSPQVKEIIIYCPKRIQIGPVNVATEWEQRLNTWVDFSYAQVSTDSATKEQLVGCWYGDASRPVSIGQKAPAGYSCAVTGISVTCKMRTRIRTND